MSLTQKNTLVKIPEHFTDNIFAPSKKIIALN